MAANSSSGAPLHAPSLDHLGDAIAELSARIQAATYELLVLVREFDEREGWNDGFRSCAHWLCWRTGLDLGAAREKVRVARALADLPRLGDAMRRGAISYSKLRALTRVATPDNERELLDFARAATAAHVERLVRAWRRVDRAAEADGDRRRHAQRYLQMRVDDDGMVVVHGRLPAEVGAVVRRALDAAADRLRDESRACDETAGGGGGADGAVVETTAGQRRADALGLVAEAALAADLDHGTAGDRYQVVVHVDDGVLAAAGAGQTVAAASAGGGQSVVEVDGGDALYVSAETSRRVACDAGRVVMRHGAGGRVLDVGRKTRTISPALRRALSARDRHCRFPGCSARRCDAHHVRHWADGGATKLDNLVLLCRRHHRAVHEEGFRLRAGGSGRDGTGQTGGADDIRFHKPDGRPLPHVPPSPVWSGPPLALTDTNLQRAGLSIGPHTATPHWAGERFDVGWAVDVLWRPRPELFIVK